MLVGRVCAFWVLLAAAAALDARAQIVPPSATATTAAATQPSQPAQPPPDVLGRTTPRRTVLGFLAAARKDDDELARQYLNSRATDDAARDLAHQLYVVLDARLPAKLTLLSDAPEGSRANPLEPDRDTVGTIEGPGGPVT